MLTFLEGLGVLRDPQTDAAEPDGLNDLLSDQTGGCISVGQPEMREHCLLGYVQTMSQNTRGICADTARMC